MLCETYPLDKHFEILLGITIQMQPALKHLARLV